MLIQPLQKSWFVLYWVCEHKIIHLKSTNYNLHGVAGDFNEKKAIFQVAGMEKIQQRNKCAVGSGARRGQELFDWRLRKERIQVLYIDWLQPCRRHRQNLFLQDLDDMDTFFWSCPRYSILSCILVNRLLFLMKCSFFLALEAQSNTS